MYNVNKYFLQIEPDLEKTALLGGPVFIPDTRDEIGVIDDYDADTGFAKVRLHEQVNYKDLIISGVPMEHIVFGCEA